MMCGLCFGSPIAFLFAALTLPAHVPPFVTLVAFVLGAFVGARIVVGILRRNSASTENDGTDLPPPASPEINQAVPLTRHSERNEETMSKQETKVVKAGELIPFDGIVVDGCAQVDESAVCGVSKPALIEAGDGSVQVFKDTLVIDGELTIISKLAA
jgi:cation transport ATPase